MHLVDTHQHFWDRSRFRYPWTEGAGPLDRSFTIEQYEEAVRDTGITKTVFMECDADEGHMLEEARHVQELSQAHPRIAAIVASARPEADQIAFRAHLEALRALPKVKGVRRVLHTQPDDLSTSSGFRQNLQLLPDYGFTFDLCVLARQLPVARNLAAACPEVSFILDHCGVPDVKGKVLDPWREHIQALADLPNVVACKISGLVAYADAESWSVDDLRPWFEHAVTCFGWDRLVWGGDWPVCTVSADLRAWVDATHELTEGVTNAERARLYHLNAERIYRV